MNGEAFNGSSSAQISDTTSVSFDLWVTYGHFVLIVRSHLLELIFAIEKQEHLVKSSVIY